MILLITGGWLVGLVNTISQPSEETSFREVGVALFGFVILMVAIGGILALLIGQFPKGMALEDGLRWEQARAKGKWIYVCNFVVLVSLPIIVLMGLIMLLPTESTQIPYSEVVRNYIVFSIVVMGLAFFAGVRFWNDNEEQYNSLRSKSQHSESSQEGNSEAELNN